VDNVGYFQMDNKWTAAKFIALAKIIEESYPTRSGVSVNEPSVEFYVDTDTSPQRYLDTTTRARIMLTTKTVELANPDKSVQWSVIPEGAAVLSEPIEMIPGMDTEEYDARMVNFTESGTVTIRVSLTAYPSVYNDFTVYVKPNTSALQGLVDEAMEYTDYFSDETWETLQKAIDKAVKLLDDYKRPENEFASQKAIDDMYNELQKAINLNLYGAEDEQSLPEPEDGTVKGKLLDENGKPVSGARIILYSVDGSGEYSSLTGSNGNFEFKNVPVGSYGLALIGPDGNEIQCDLLVEVEKGMIVNVNARYNGEKFEGSTNPVTGVPAPVLPACIGLFSQQYWQEH